MANADGKVTIDVELNGDGAKKGIDGLDKDITKLDNNSKSKFKGLASGFKGVGLAALGIVGSVAAVGGAIGALAAPLVSAAGAAQAAQAQFSTVFKELESDARSSLNAIAEETGIIPERLQGSFTQIAAFAKTTGVDTAEALELTSRATLAAADSAAFYDRSIEEVTENLQSFLKGNYENDAALGISATETTRNTIANELYGKSFQKLTEYQKQDALLALVEQGNELSGALGQAAVESDGLENVLGNLRQAFQNLLVELGNPLLGTAVEGIQLLTAALQSITLEGIISNFQQLQETFSGIGESSTQASESLNNVKSAFSEGFSTVVDFVKEQLTTILGFWEENGIQISSAVSNAFNLILSIFNAIFPAILVVVKFVWDAITDVIEGALGVIQGIINVFTGIFTGDFSKLWEGIRGIFASGIQLVLGILNLTFVGSIRTIFVNLAKTLLTSITRNWTSILSVIRSFSTGIVNVLRSFISGAINLFKNFAAQGISNFNTLRAFGANAFNALRQAVVASVQGLYRNFITTIGNLRQQASAIFTNISTSIINAVKGLPGSFLSLGRNIVQGLINGIKSLNPVTVITNIAGDMVTKFKEKLRIFSPSRVFTELGLFISQGLANGIRNNASLVINAVSALGDEIIKSGTQATKTVALINRVTRKEAQNEASAINKQLAADRKKVTQDLNKAINELEKKAAEQDKKSKERIAKARADSDRRIANATAKNRAKVAADENRSIAALQSSEAKKAVERENNLNSRIAKLRQKAVDTRVKLNANAAKQIAKIESDLASDRLKALEDAAELRVNNGTFDPIDEARFWENAIKTFKVGSEEYLKAQRNYAKVTKSINDEITKANNDYISENNRVNNELKASLEALSKTYDDEYQRVFKSLNNFAGLFQEIEFEEVNGQDLINNLSDQVQALNTYIAEFDRISGRGLSQALIDELRELGVDALPQLIALNNLTDDELKKYSDIYDERARIARENTEKQLTDLRENTKKQIEELTKTANAELLILQNQWLENIKEITQGTSDELLTLEQIGKDSAQLLLDGLNSLTGPLETQAQALGQTISDALKKGLGIDLGINNPFSGKPLTTNTALNDVVNGANAVVNARNSANQGTVNISSSDVILDNKVIGKIVYTVTNGIQNANFSLNQTIKGATN